jgi:type IX secretion system PorP/SprF family membrane protein
MLKILQFRNWVLLVLLALGVGSTGARAQQDKMYSQYMFNMMALNPAYAGSREVLSATGLYRNQWVGIEGAPRTITFTLDAPVSKDQVGLGFQAYNDQIGIFNETGAFGTYAFRIRMGDKSTLALGLQAGAVSIQANYADVKTVPGSNGGDPAFSTNLSKFLPNFGTGVYLSSDRSYVGISVPQLLVHNLTEYNSGENRAKQRRHAYMMAGFVVGISNSLKLKPSMLVKYANGAPLGLDGNLNLWINDRLAIGTSYRRNQFSTFQASADTFTSDAAIAMLEVQLTDQLRLGYAYDMMLNGLRQQTTGINTGSHELMIRYEFGFTKTKILTPRYF